MGSFSIVNKEGKPVSLSELNSDAAEFWGLEEPYPGYAAPPPKSESVFEELNSINLDWVQTIGWAIVYCRSRGDWDIVKKKLSGFDDHIRLIDHWIVKGYSPMYSRI